MDELNTKYSEIIDNKIGITSKCSSLKNQEGNTPTEEIKNLNVNKCNFNNKNSENNGESEIEQINLKEMSNSSD